MAQIGRRSICSTFKWTLRWVSLLFGGKTLFYAFSSHLQGPVIENISQRCGGFLKYLSLKGCQSVGDQSIRTLAQHCHNIEHLDLTECKKITDAATEPLSKHCNKLTSVSLESCSQISDLSLKSLSDGCPVSCAWTHCAQWFGGGMGDESMHKIKGCIISVHWLIHFGVVFTHWRWPSMKSIEHALPSGHISSCNHIPSLVHLWLWLASFNASPFFRLVRRIF